MENLIMDFYELTMGQPYYDKNLHEQIAYFDLYYRKNPDNSGFVIANGINNCLKYLMQFKFSESDIEYLKSLNKFSDAYLNYLSKIKFGGDVWAVEDGTVVFPNEPVITIKAPLLQAQLVETALLLIFNRSSLITTKANRIVRSASGRAIMEFGTRRAQGINAAVDGAVDAYVGGAVGTACTLAGKKYGTPVLGTMAHSFVQVFDSELEAFKAYAETYPDSCTLLVDTYNTLKSGIPNAIKTYNEVLKPMGKKLTGIRIDSGDLDFLSKQARIMLDKAGLFDTKIVASNSLDENVIKKLVDNNAPIDVFGVGENLITSKSCPILGGVYKLVAIEKENQIVPKIKISDTTDKLINPHFKKLYRVYDNNNQIFTDILCVYDERLFNIKGKNNQAEDFVIKNLKPKMIEAGNLIYKIPTIEETRKKVNDEIATLKPQMLDLNNSKTIKVMLSAKLQRIKNKLMQSSQVKDL